MMYVGVVGYTIEDKNWLEIPQKLEVSSYWSGNNFVGTPKVKTAPSKIENLSEDKLRISVHRTAPNWGVLWRIPNFMIQYPAPPIYLSLCCFNGNLTVRLI